MASSKERCRGSLKSSKRFDVGAADRFLPHRLLWGLTVSTSIRWIAQTSHVRSGSKAIRPQLNKGTVRLVRTSAAAVA
jgi:hypothetical protein